MSNIKVHFAGYDNNLRAIAVLRSAEVNYRLFTCYPFIKSKRVGQDMRVSNLYETQAGFKHLILDSGLFTMMFGAEGGGAKTKEDIREWMHRIVQFVQQNNITASIVECDCQKLISPEFAWELRKELRQLLPNHEIISPFHLEDGEDGFRKLVDFSEYIAISVPELRIAQPKTYKNTVCALSRIARKQKPSIKIHLLGCTEEYLLKRNTFCTSADSSSWTSSARFGRIANRHVSQLSESAVSDAMDTITSYANKHGEEFQKQFTRLNEKGMHYTAVNYWDAVLSKASYSKWAGSQD